MIETLLVLLLVAIAVMFSYRRGEAAGQLQGLEIGRRLSVQWQLLDEIAEHIEDYDQQLIAQLENDEITAEQYHQLLEQHISDFLQNRRK